MNPNSLSFFLFIKLILSRSDKSTEKPPPLEIKVIEKKSVQPKNDDKKQSLVDQKNLSSYSLEQLFERYKSKNNRLYYLCTRNKS